MLLATVLLIAGCSFQKKSGFNRAMQNLTAHYNILFNANEILKQKQADYALSFTDNYGDILNVYQDTILHTSAQDKDLEAAMAKANLIINEKEQSHYIADAYLVIGKANFLYANYFNAAEFFNYVIHSFTDKKSSDIVQEARAWKARSLIYLKNLPEAKATIDTALLNLNTKQRITADVYATALAYDIAAQEYEHAEDMAKKAIAYCKTHSQKLRCIFILGQLQELNKQNAGAIASYTKIVKSNALFEMAFNANLNRIRISDEQQGMQMSRTQRLLSLLRNQNNKDFIDQIYYQVGEIYRADNDIDNAVKYYKLSLRNSHNNQNQKGLAYLRIADIDFKNKADYVGAKKYYDSTLTNLSPSYPGYITIQKKSNNLQLLADRLWIIAREDTLQRLAKLDEKTRLEVIDSLVIKQTLLQQQIAAANFAATTFNTRTNVPSTSASLPIASNFYFYNAAAVSQGYNDFKRRWGNRKLEDNWRRSSRASSDITAANNSAVPGTTLNGDPDALPNGVRPKTANDVTAGSYRQSLLQNLPLTPQLLAQSNLRVYNAYLDIANFYRDILDDKKEAIANYLLLLDKFPEDPNKPAIYYSLYRLYTDVDVTQANVYKDKLLKEFPATTFAKVITDPDYSRHMDDNDAVFNTAYNQAYNLYAQKKYGQAISNIDALLQQYPNNKFSAQLSYLRAISAGHQENLTAFQNDLQQITAKYPDDALVTPLIKQHLTYINANRDALAAQTYVLTDNDTTGTLFIPPIDYRKETALRRNITMPVVTQQRIEPVVTPANQPKPVAPQVTTLATVTPAPVVPPSAVAQQPPNVNAPPKFVSTLFNERDSTEYYFVVNVATGTTDMAPSRFGIGQYNRANNVPTSVKHQLTNAGPDNQLIYIGLFNTLEDAKAYARNIIPLMPQIMKVPKDKYSFFIITKENLDKLASKELLDSYIDYYQKTY